MSYRRSFPGIAEAWIARGNGKQKAFVFIVNTLAVECETDNDGDITPENTLSVECSVGFDGVETGIELDVVCATDDEGDVTPTNTLSVQCLVEVEDP